MSAGFLKKGHGNRHYIYSDAIRNEGGQTLVEFAFVAFLLIAVVFGVIEFSRLVLVYTTIANAARAGVRYAIVHGSDSPSPATSSDVTSAVRSIAGGAPLTASSVNVTVTPTSIGTAGSTVTVSVSYAYDPFTTYFPFRVTLGSTSQGVVTY